MRGILDGIAVAECAAFIACPYATMTLAQLGADVIRIDGLNGGLDYRRWPVTTPAWTLTSLTQRSTCWAPTPLQSIKKLEVVT